MALTTQRPRLDNKYGKSKTRATIKTKHVNSNSAPSLWMALASKLKEQIFIIKE